MKNVDLKQKYDKIYQNGSGSFYTFSSFPESKLILDFMPGWAGLNVLEIGCGEGRLAAMIGFAGAAKVDAVDYSAEAIAVARKRVSLDNVDFECRDYHGMRRRYDVVILQGVAEHLDRPFEELKAIMDRNLKKDGVLITSSPSFLNPRGHVWMALKLLLNVPMSLTDLHYLCPFDFEDFARSNGYALEMRSTDLDWGGGARTIVDFRRRLPNALRDAGLDTSGVTRFLEWFEKALANPELGELGGATVAYKLKRTARG